MDILRKPVIGITCNTLLAEGTVLPGMIRAFANTDYIDAVTKAEGIPILLPPVANPALISEQVAAVDGLIMSGGPDVDPQLYGEEPLEKLGCVNHVRDEYELLVVKAAAQLKNLSWAFAAVYKLSTLPMAGHYIKIYPKLKGQALNTFRRLPKETPCGIL